MKETTPDYFITYNEKICFHFQNLYTQVETFMRFNIPSITEYHDQACNNPIVIKQVQIDLCRVPNTYFNIVYPQFIRSKNSTLNSNGNGGMNHNDENYVLSFAEWMCQKGIKLSKKCLLSPSPYDEPLPAVMSDVSEDYSYYYNIVNNQMAKKTDDIFSDDWRLADGLNFGDDQSASGAKPPTYYEQTFSRWQNTIIFQPTSAPAWSPSVSLKPIFKLASSAIPSVGAPENYMITIEQVQLCVFKYLFR